MREIQLTQGQVALVDDADYEALSQHKWFYNAGGYACRMIGGRKNRRMVYMHRELLGAGPGQVVDHRDGNRSNNCRGNLRLATVTENSRNGAIRRTNQSGYKGVSFRRGRWRAAIVVDGQQHHLGDFETADAAAAVYDDAAVRMHGEFGRPNGTVSQ